MVVLLLNLFIDTVVHSGLFQEFVFYSVISKYCPSSTHFTSELMQY